MIVFEKCFRRWKYSGLYIFSILSEWSIDTGKFELKQEIYIDGMDNSPDEKYPPIVVPLSNQTISSYNDHIYASTENGTQINPQFKEIRGKY
mgnify:CR=1 FL=1